MKRLDMAREVTMAGGFNAVLTAAERNAWHDYAVDRPEYERWREAVVESKIEGKLITKDNQIDFRSAMDELHNAECAMYEIGRIWVASLQLDVEEV